MEGHLKCRLDFRWCHREIVLQWMGCQTILQSLNGLVEELVGFLVRDESIDDVGGDRDCEKCESRWRGWPSKKNGRKFYNNYEL